MNFSILDSCSCCGNSPQGCRAAGCMTSMTWCPICDHNKARRRCQSEGLYQEMDPLKELNRCCDKGCDYIHYSLHHSQMKKTDIESEEKKHLCSDTAEMEIGDVCLGNKKHPKPHKDKYLLMERNTQFHQDTASNGISLPSMFENSRKVPVGFYHRNRDFNLDRSNLKYENIRSGYSKYNSIGDSLDIELPGNKSTSYLEQDKHSAEMREKYVREMEILRSKLNLLKGEMACDGKRLRQRSESEPGFPEIAGGVPKRARDNSPKFKYGCRKLPVSPPVNQLCNRTLNKQNIACKESKTEHLQSQACKV